ncbi:MAG: patatin-like phospholipase family protein [Pikeienuella sp.]
MKRAITLGGGGPAAGLHLGALKAFEEFDIEFDVWSLSCIGVWVGGQYLSYPKDEALAKTIEHFRKYIFVDDVTYDKWPIGAGFTPNLQSWAEAGMKFMTDPKSYQNLVSPAATAIAMERWQTFMSDPKYWQPAGFNQLFAATAAANPITRFLVSLMWLSPLTGLTGGSQPGPSLTPNTDVDALFNPGQPFVYHNAWNMRDDKIQLFSNQKNPDHGMMTLSSASMGAASALPYIIQPKVIDGIPYCEGALVRTVSFTDLLRDHPDLEEIWVIRIVDPAQVRPTQNMDDAMNNLTMLFAGALGEANVQNYQDEVQIHFPELYDRITFIDVPVSHEVNFDWTHSNLDLGIQQGYKNTKESILALQAKG